MKKINSLLLSDLQEDREIAKILMKHKYRWLIYIEYLLTPITFIGMVPFLFWFTHLSMCKDENRKIRPIRVSFVEFFLMFRAIDWYNNDFAGCYYSSEKPEFFGSTNKFFASIIMFDKQTYTLSPIGWGVAEIFRKKMVKKYE